MIILQVFLKMTRFTENGQEINAEKLRSFTLKDIDRETDVDRQGDLSIIYA